MKYLLFLSALFFFGIHLYSQEKTVTGKITTFKELPVINVTLLVQSSGKKFYSDSLGNYSLQCQPTDKLVVSAEGFNNKRVNIKKESNSVDINLILSPADDAKDLAIGYGHVKDKDKLYAIASYNESGIEYSHYRNINEILESNFTGVQVINGEIIIRNSNSLNGTNPALIILDGREVSSANIAAISTNEIASINVLKDASASVYGVRGANGVVIVQTKRGKK